MVRPRFSGSSASSGCGLPWATSQNGQRRVQMSPMIMKVAVPPAKHSPRFGQDASSHTVCRRFSRSTPLSRPTAGLAGERARIHGGLRSARVVVSILIGMRAVFAAPRCFISSSFMIGSVQQAFEVLPVLHGYGTERDIDAQVRQLGDLEAGVAAG